MHIYSYVLIYFRFYFVACKVSVLTDQVEAQGEKIRDLESSLEGHRQKLASTEEMLQQVVNSHTHTYKLHLRNTHATRLQTVKLNIGL